LTLPEPESTDIYFETPTVDLRGEIVEHRRCTARLFVEPLGEDVSLEMVEVPAGMFSMGSPAHAGYPDEHPLRPVSIRPFALGRFTLTQRQWLALMRKPLPCRFPDPRLPLDRASWDDAQDFCRRLARLTGRAYRLPSEAEWEYACRAGTGTPFSCGPTLTTHLANYVGEHTFAQEPKGVYRHTSTPPGEFPPNPFGLCDLHGNLWEWCADAWHPDYTGAPLDGSAWDAPGATQRVTRGGSWHEPPQNCRSAVRLACLAAEREDLIGFRVALSLPPGPPAAN